MPYKFEISKDKGDKFRFVLIAPNGQVILQSQGYSDKSSAKKTIESIKKNAGDAEIVDKSKEE
ncbi:MAG: YegP family protein [Calditrichaceae bacterium]|nr:YegP family protein [Calditrichia bacterium]NUQ43291.1 YegP family protein [Calditrichaceae bacterium]